MNEWSEVSDKYQESFEEEEVENEEDEEKEQAVSHVTHQPLPNDILLDDDLISDPNMQLANDGEHQEEEDDEEKEDAKDTAIDGMDLETYMNSAINSRSENDENGTPEMMDTMMQGLDGVSPPESRRKRSVRIATPPTHRSQNSDTSSPSQHVLQSILHEISDMKSQLHELHVSPNKTTDISHRYDHLLHRKPTKSMKTLLKHKKQDAQDVNYNLSASGVAKLEPTDETKMNKLISEIHRYSSIIERQNDKIAMLEAHVCELSSIVEQKDDTIQKQIGKVNRALRAKKQLSKRVDELQLELADYEQVLAAVESLRQNETQLLQKVQYLMNQNEDLSIQLKNSLTREIELRNMHKIELSNQLHATTVPPIAKHEKTASAPTLASRTTDKPQNSSNSRTSKKKKQKRHSISENILPRISKA